MFRKINKIISIVLTIIFITGLFPPVIFAQPTSTLSGEVKGFNRTVMDSHFSRADREINPERWLAEAKFGVTQAICAWELIADGLYENPLLFEEAKAQIVKWSDEELEKRFSQWLMGRFFGKAAEEALLNLSSKLNESQKYYSWHLDEEGNVIFDDKTGDPLIIRPNEEGREFSHELTLWRGETDDIVNATSASFNNVINSLYPELLAYIPVESRESISAVIKETFNAKSNVIKREFENIAAREERVFTNRRTRDIWSLRKKSDDEAARKFTEKLIAEADESCKKGIEELNAKIEQASAGAGDLALLGEEWLRLYAEQFERGLKAWEDAEERFFIRRIEWEQESIKLFSEGEAVWLSALNQFEEEKQKWELNAKELFQTGESLFKNISKDFEKTIAEAKKEFELNAAIRIGEGTNKVKALIDMYLVSSSAAVSLVDNFKFWQRQYGNDEKDIKDSDLPEWIYQETVNLWKQAESSYLEDPEYISDLEKLAIIDSSKKNPFKNTSSYIYAFFGLNINYDQLLIELNEKHSKLYQIQDFLKGEMTLSEQIVFAENIDTKHFSKYKFEALIEMLNLYNMYPLYVEKSINARNNIYENYVELFGTGTLKDILSPDASSDDFYMDEYQIALIRAKALVLYWERKTSIADAVMAYAEELGAERMTEAEGLQAWEKAKAAYNKSLAVYEAELSTLNKIGADIQKQQDILNNLTLQMQREEERLNNLYSDYSSLLSMSATNPEDYYFTDFNEKYNNLVIKYNNYKKKGADSVYYSALNYGLLWEIAEQREAEEEILKKLETSDDLSEEKIMTLNEDLNALNPTFRNELWENTCNSLSLLFSNYGLNTEINIIPDVKSICLAIFDIPGDFAENTAKFMMDFDNCFSSVHRWLQYEIDEWKEAIIEYITTFAFSYNIKPEKNKTELATLYDNLKAEYEDLYQYAITYDYDAADDDSADKLNNAFIKINNKLKMFDYINKISESLELMKLNAPIENEAHWRQYLLNEYITNKDPSLVMVSSWASGVLADALYYASYCTNRVNDSFNIYSQKNIFYTDDNAEQLYNLYFAETKQIFFDFYTLKSQYIETGNAAKLLGFSKLSPNDIKNKLSFTKNAIKNYEDTVNSFKDNYFNEANKFIDIGLQYDNQYNILKNAYNDTDQKRFEYEKQDAIQKWASTSYLNTDNIDPAGCRANLSKANIVLNILSDISNNSNKTAYNNPEYEALYTAYEQCFTKKIKVFEAIEMLSSSYMQERMNNSNIHQQYQNSLFQLGINFNYKDYKLPASESEWKIENIITVKNGRLAFSRNESMNIIGVNSTEVMPVIDFFNKTESVNGEYVEITGYEAALRGLSQRMSGYFMDQNKFRQWSYARNYLILSLKNTYNSLNFMNNYISIGGELRGNGSLAYEYINLNKLEKNITLSSYMEGSIINNYYTFFQNEWNKLSAEEKADLEFYVILTLTTGNNYFAGFKEMYNYDTYVYAENKVYSLYKEAQKIVDVWINPLAFLWIEPRDINKNTYNRIDSVRQGSANFIAKWTNGLNNNLISNKYLSDLYASSCKNLEEFESKKTEGSKIVWSDLELSLSKTKIKPEDLAVIKTCWETMQKNAANAYLNVFDALLALSDWTNNEVYYAKNNLETRFSADMNNQLSLNNVFLSAVDNYFNGTAEISTVRTAANDAYSKNTVSVKSYFDKMYDVSIKNLSMYTNTEFNLNSLFNNIGEEIITLTTNTIKNKYSTELSAREEEWKLMRKDITEKYNEWQSTAAQILENGRKDWTDNFKKLENAYKQWNSNFQSEYDRVNNEWIYAYLAGLEDKEEWLQQAADAANQASSEAFLSLIGAEGERLSRFIDTREPLGIRDAIPEVQELMTGLLQSSGIVNMTGTFNSLNNFTNITSPLVKRGIGGASSWDSALVKMAASDLARTTNAEIAKNESKKLAYNARISADEAIKGLTGMVVTANQNFTENMDNMFILKGLWRKTGNDYVKDIIKGSTVFTPVILETITIAGYRNYIMEPVTLKTNLDKNYLASLDTIAIQGLINDVYNEVETIAGEIFGRDENKIPINKNGVYREQSPGKFGTHIGYDPAIKQSDHAVKNKAEMFYDEGGGELGRLLSDYQYWYSIDRIGSAELTIAPWDKRIWDDEGSWFQAPSIRTVGAIAGSVAAAVAITVGTFGTGTAAAIAGAAVSIALCSSSEIALGALDVAFEYKPLDEVAVSVGKTVLINTVTSGIGGAFNGVSSAATSIFSKTVMAGTQTFATGIAANAINGITYSSGKGFGYSAETFNAGMEGIFNNSLVYMASALTSSTLTAINCGLDYSKVEGFNNLNKSDLQNFNNLIGSLVGQGVNYALGNDFTLNVLNLGLLTNNEFNSGLLELHLGHDGVKMNIGTGGANVSIDNLAIAYRGLQVWDVNTKISNYGKKNNFDALISLRAQYGYGDDVQKEQLWDILKGNTLINTSAEGDYFAETTINEDGKRVINLAGYENGMSKEDQYLLGVVFGYEAYRDGYTIGQTDASGEMYTSQTQSDNIAAATIASMTMVERIIQENDWFDDVFERFAFYDFVEKDFNKVSLFNNNNFFSNDNDSLSNDNDSLSSDNDYFEEFNPKGVVNFNITTNDDYQDKKDYIDTPLFLSDTKATVDKINEQRAWSAFLKYKNIIYKYNKNITYEEFDKKNRIQYKEEFEKFKEDKELLEKHGYIKEEFITIYSSGCLFMSTKYILEKYLGEIDTIDFHKYIIKNNYFTNQCLLPNTTIAKIMTSYSNNEYTVKYMKEFEEWEEKQIGKDKIYIRKPPTIETFNKIIASSEEYFMIIKIQDPIKKTIPHFVAVTSIEYTKNETGNIISIDNFTVANSLKQSTYFNSKLNFGPKDILVYNIFSITKNK